LLKKIFSSPFFIVQLEKAAVDSSLIINRGVPRIFPGACVRASRDMESTGEDVLKACGRCFACGATDPQTCDFCAVGAVEQASLAMEHLLDDAQRMCGFDAKTLREITELGPDDFEKLRNVLDPHRIR
jgi:hypothetical protein